MDSTGHEHYRFVLEDARRELARIDAAFQELEAKRERASATVQFLEEKAYGAADKFAPPPPSTGSESEESTLTGGAYSGLTLIDAVVKVLETSRALMDTRTICNELEEGGFETKAKDLYNTTYGTLFNTVKRDDSPIVKIGNNWGLRSWKLHHRVSAGDSVEGSSTQ